MELQYVQPGEKVTAQGYNNVVDAIFAGVNSSEGFQNTTNGAVVYPRAQLITSYQSGAWRTMFQVKTAQYWKQTTRGQWDPPNMHNTVIIDLGPDADTCKSNINIMGQNVKEAGIVVGESPSMDCLLEDPVYVNASEKKTSWIDLGIDASSTDFIAADAFKCIQEEGEGDDKKQVTNYYFVVTDKSEDDVVDRAKQLFGISDEPFVRVKRFMLAKKGQVGRLDESEVYVQSHTGAILWSMPAPEMISVDSDISSIMLSSLETLSVEYQISGLSGEMETKIGSVYSFWNFEKAERISLGEALDKEASESPGQETSCRVDVVLRVGRKDNTLTGPTEVEYLELSSLVVSCDTNFYSKEPKEMKSTSIEWTTAEKGQPALQLKGFKDEESLENPPDKYSLIIREKNDDDERILKYIDPTDVFKVDSDISSLHRKSLEKKTDPEDADKKFVQLYNFDEPGDLVLSVDKYTKRLPEGYKLVVRHEKSGDEDNDIEVEYADLSIDVQNMSADTEFENKTKSIDADRTDNYFKLHNFENAGTVDETFEPSKENNYIAPEDCELLYRDGDELKYCRLNLSTAVDEILSSSQKLYKADSEFPNEQLSSLERREQEEDDPEKEGKKVKRQEFSMYKFNQPEYRATRSEIMDDSTVLVRENLTGGQKMLRYVDLSSFEQPISGDVDIDQDGQKQKSVEFKFTDDKQKYAQLYNFESTAADVKLNISEQNPESGEKYHFLVKKISDGKLNELQFAEVSSVLSAAVDDKSIEVNADNDDKLQLKYFDQDSYTNITLSAGQWFDQEGKQCIVGKNLETGEVNYYNFKVELSGLSSSLSADTEVRQDESYATQSIDAAYSTQDKANFHRLHNFELDAVAEKADWDDTMHVLIRKKQDSNLELDYIRLSDLSGANISVDSEGTTNKKSISRNSKNELQIYNFENGRNDLTGTFQANGKLPDGFDVLVRYDNEIHYANLSVDHTQINEQLSVLSGNTKVDSEANVGLSSIQRYSYTGDDGKSYKAYSLYDFNKDDKVALDDLNKDTDALLVRTGTGNKVLKYLDLSCLSSPANISVDSEGNTNKKSISRNSNGELQIYNFENATTDITASFVNGYKLPDDVQVLVRYDNEIHYANLSVQPGGAISVDTEYSNTSESIQKQNDGVVKINGWDTKTAKSVTEVSSYADDYDVLMRHHTNGKYQTEFINIAPLLSGGGGSAPEKRKIGKNWDWPTDISGNYIAPGAADAIMYGYYIYGHHITYWSGNIPAQPANKNLLILSVEYGGSGYPKNQQFTWAQYTDNSTLSGIGIPLYARYNSPDGGPTYDYNAGVFTIPVYE